VKPPARALPIACLLLWGCATGGTGRSTERPTANDVVACLDSLRPTDSVTSIVKLSVSSLDTSVKLPADFENLFADEFRRRFKAPATTPLSVVMGTPPCDSLGSRCMAGVLDIGAIAYATAQNDGKLRDVETVDIALVPSFVDTVRSVLAAISHQSLVPPIGNVESVPLILELATEQQPDSIPVYRQIFRVKLPRYQIPFGYASMPTAGIDASYPFTARIAGVGDTVAVAFTVTADGLIYPGSLELVRASYREFVGSVASALLKTRYHPARLGDCPVATRMEQRFLFRAPE
jgi:hypothetical protein